METGLHDTIFQGLKTFMSAVTMPTGLTLAVVKTAPSNPTYPQLKFMERRNQSTPEGLDSRQRVSSIGFEVSVYMNTVPTQDKDSVVRLVLEYADQYLTVIEGLKRVSCNYFDEEPYRALAMYSCVYFENKQILY